MFTFAMFSTDNRLEISVSIPLLLQNLSLLVERASLCSLQIIALKLACQYRESKDRQVINQDALLSIEFATLADPSYARVKIELQVINQDLKLSEDLGSIIEGKDELLSLNRNI